MVESATSSFCAPSVSPGGWEKRRDPLGLAENKSVIRKLSEVGEEPDVLYSGRGAACRTQCESELHQVCVLVTTQSLWITSLKGEILVRILLSEISKFTRYDDPPVICLGYSHWGNTLQLILQCIDVVDFVEVLTSRVKSDVPFTVSKSLAEDGIKLDIDSQLRKSDLQQHIFATSLSERCLDSFTEASVHSEAGSSPRVPTERNMSPRGEKNVMPTRMPTRHNSVVSVNHSNPQSRFKYDPRTGLPIISMPPDVEGLYPDLDRGVIHHWESIMKVTHKGKQQKRLLVITDACVYLCDTSRGKKGLTRCTHITSISAIYASRDMPGGYIALKIPDENYDSVFKSTNHSAIISTLQTIASAGFNYTLPITKWAVNDISKKHIVNGIARVGGHQFSLQKPNEYKVMVHSPTSTRVLAAAAAERERESKALHFSRSHRLLLSPTSGVASPDSRPLQSSDITRLPPSGSQLLDMPGIALSPAVSDCDSSPSEAGTSADVPAVERRSKKVDKEIEEFRSSTSSVLDLACLLLNRGHVSRVEQLLKKASDHISNRRLSSQSLSDLCSEYEAALVAEPSPSHGSNRSSSSLPPSEDPPDGDLETLCSVEDENGNTVASLPQHETGTQKEKELGPHQSLTGFAEFIKEKMKEGKEADEEEEMQPPVLTAAASPSSMPSSPGSPMNATMQSFGSYRTNGRIASDASKTNNTHSSFRSGRVSHSQGVQAFGSYRVSKGSRGGEGMQSYGSYRTRGSSVRVAEGTQTWGSFRASDLKEKGDRYFSSTEAIPVESDSDDGREFDQQENDPTTAEGMEHGQESINEMEEEPEEETSEEDDESLLLGILPREWEESGDYECHGEVCISWGVFATWHSRLLAYKNGYLCYYLPSNKWGMLLNISEVTKIVSKAQLPGGVLSPPNRPRSPYLMQIICSEQSYLFSFESSDERVAWADTLEAAKEKRNRKGKSAVATRRSSPAKETNLKSSPTRNVVSADGCADAIRVDPTNTQTEPLHCSFPEQNWIRSLRVR
eukprot:TRINITY_DN3702_c5_g1_i1.p1 TRINITY_DN3702_c5_g1~~TRINITY_DN3702_c5_g1_i1.p1  ORF type:complete len:1017 (+),score=226.19 TRINITY_DN3702_c5_g1_i1:111-3161(+)